MRAFSIVNSLRVTCATSVPKRASVGVIPTLFYPSRNLHSTYFSRMPNKHNHKGAVKEHIDKKHSSKADEAHQFQAGTSTNRKEDEWKHREPYRIHDDDEEFDVKWRGGCHCGKIKYQLSREAPLASKYCHCTTCQRLHGVS